MVAQRDRYGEIAWRKSSASGNNEGCVEVAVREPFVMVRDSRNRLGEVLNVTPERWRDFLDYLRAGVTDGASGRRSA
jgi:hypothetical protein